MWVRVLVGSVLLSLSVAGTPALASDAGRAAAQVDRAGQADQAHPADHAGHAHQTQPPDPDHVDPAPAGVDVRRSVSTESLRAAIRARRGHKTAELRARTAAGRAPRAALATPEVLTPAENAPAGYSALPGLVGHVATSCRGDGADGNRVQALYVVEAGRPDRFAQVRPLLLDELANVDDTFALSAARTGGGLRVRWVRDPATCAPSLVKAVVPAGALADFGASVSALRALGYTAANRKYLFFADASALCGIGHQFLDESVTGNWNDGRAAMFARVDTGCWLAGSQGSVAAHELMHNLGAIQRGAPHASAAGHCTDDHDRMCYPDASGTTMAAVCPSADEPLFDCGNDDYFHTAPPAGNYLATHWNTADSRFLDDVGALGEPPAVTVEGPTSVRPGLGATLVATASEPGRHLWRVAPAGCVVGRTDAAALTLQCPTSVRGSVTASLSFAAADDGAVAQVTRVVSLGGSPAVLSPGLSAPARAYVAQTIGVVGTARWGTTPVRGEVRLWAYPDGASGWSLLAGPVDLGPDGSYTFRVTPRRSTTYLLQSTQAAGWATTADVTVRVAVRRRATVARVWARDGRPDVVTGRLVDVSTGRAMAGQRLVLERRWAGTSTWRAVRARTTSASGYVRSGVLTGRTGYYRWRYAGSSGYYGDRSTAARLT